MFFQNLEIIVITPFLVMFEEDIYIYIYIYIQIFIYIYIQQNLCLRVLRLPCEMFFLVLKKNVKFPPGRGESRLRICSDPIVKATKNHFAETKNHYIKGQFGVPLTVYPWYL